MVCSRLFWSWLWDIPFKTPPSPSVFIYFFFFLFNNPFANFIKRQSPSETCGTQVSFEWLCYIICIYRWVIKRSFFLIIWTLCLILEIMKKSWIGLVEWVDQIISKMRMWNVHHQVCHLLIDCFTSNLNVPKHSPGKELSKGISKDVQ